MNLGKPRKIKIYACVSQLPPKWGVIELQARSVTICNKKLFIHRTASIAPIRKWTITEPSTGWSVALGDTISIAIFKAQEILGMVSEEKYKRALSLGKNKLEEIGAPFPLNEV